MNNNDYALTGYTRAMQFLANSNFFAFKIMELNLFLKFMLVMFLY